MKDKLSYLDKAALKAKKIMESKKRIKAVKLAILTTILMMLAIVFLAPIVLTISNSFMNKTEIEFDYGAVFSRGTHSNAVKAKTVNLKFIPDMVSVSQYNEVLFKSPEYLYKFWNSVIYTVPIVILQVLISLGAAYGLSRHRTKGKEIILFVYIILMLLPYQVTLVPNYLVCDKLHIVNTRWAIWLPGIFSPFSVFLLTKFVRRIPVSVIEAAEIDGCNEWRIFWQIVYPLAKGAMASVGILLFIDYWNMVEQPIILLEDDGLHPLSVFLSQINTNDVGLAFAVASIYMFVPLFIFLYGEEYLIDGISFSGGVKG